MRPSGQSSLLKQCLEELEGRRQRLLQPRNVWLESAERREEAQRVEDARRVQDWLREQPDTLECGQDEETLSRDAAAASRTATRMLGLLLTTLRTVLDVRARLDEELHYIGLMEEDLMEAAKAGEGIPDEMDCQYRRRVDVYCCFIRDVPVQLECGEYLAIRVHVRQSTIYELKDPAAREPVAEDQLSEDSNESLLDRKNSEPKFLRGRSSSDESDSTSSLEALAAVEVDTGVEMWCIRSELELVLTEHYWAMLLARGLMHHLPEDVADDVRKGLRELRRVEALLRPLDVRLRELITRAPLPRVPARPPPPPPPSPPEHPLTPSLPSTPLRVPTPPPLPQLNAPADWTSLCQSTGAVSDPQLVWEQFLEIGTDLWESRLENFNT